jgi:hypothetical protein
LQLVQWQSTFVTGSPVTVYFAAPQRQDPLITEPVAFSDALVSKCLAERPVISSDAMVVELRAEVNNTDDRRVAMRKRNMLMASLYTMAISGLPVAPPKFRNVNTPVRSWSCSADKSSNIGKSQSQWEARSEER